MRSDSSGTPRTVASEEERRSTLSKSKESTSRALLDVIVAVVLVIAAASVLIFLLGALEGIVWWILKIAILFAVLYLGVRLVVSRSR